MNWNKEPFYFEVSPNRLKCLKEQVSLNKNKRSCSCCQKGTVGGYPPTFADWMSNSEQNGNWNRTDNWTPVENNQSNLPPINYVN